MLSTAQHRQTLEENLTRLCAQLQAPNFILAQAETLTFAQALAELPGKAGATGYLSEQQNREFYRQGRISDADLEAAFTAYPGLQAAAAIAGIDPEAIRRIILLHGLAPLTDQQLHWQGRELNAFTKLQADLPETARRKFLANDSESHAVAELWHCLLEKLELTQPGLTRQAPLDTAGAHPTPPVNPERHELTRQQAERELARLLAELGAGLSLPGLVLALSGVDIVDKIAPELRSLTASAVDTGVACWHLPDATRLGFYPAWRAAARYDANVWLRQLPDGQEIIAELPEQAVDAIALQLFRLGIPEPRWDGYLRRLALEPPGYARLICQRQAANPESTATLADYLAMRLVLERLRLNQVCHELWQVEAKLSALTGYFRKNLSEFFVRRQLYQGRLPEHLAALAEALIIRAGSERHCRSDWQQLADLAHGWQESRQSAADSGWRLFLICQHLGINAEELKPLSKTDLLAMLKVADDFNAARRGQTWLYALEHQYRQALFQKLKTRLREQPAKTGARPKLQVIFSLDNREESYRRQLEAADSDRETFGVGEFFYRCDDPQHPANWQNRLAQGLSASFLFGYLRPRARLALAFLAVLASAPVALLVLLSQTLWPAGWRRLTANWRQPELTPKPDSEPNPLNDAAWLTEFLLTIGLTENFARWIALIGQAPSPNAETTYLPRAQGRYAQSLADTANQGATRAYLAARGINIPEDTVFIAAEHDLAAGTLSWHDHAQQPADQLRQALALDYAQPPAANHGNHAALIIGRRALTKGLCLDRRAFLQSYEPSLDPDAKLLEKILATTLPTLARLNLDYYLTACSAAASDENGNFRLGSEPLDISRHEPMRLTVVVETRPTQLAALVGRLESLKAMLAGQWLYLAALDTERGELFVFDADLGFRAWQE